MDCKLIPEKDLHVVTSRRERGAVPGALVTLLLVVLATGVAEARLGTDAVSVAAPSSPAALPGVSQIAGTQVPAPSIDSGLVALRSKGGLHVFAPTTTLRRADASSLFAFYLDAMPAQGWSLAGKGDPAGRGDWVQRWQAGNAAALITYVTAPRQRLDVELCPPDPYC